MIFAYHCLKEEFLWKSSNKITNSIKMINSQIEIKQGITKSIQEVIDWIAAQETAKFEQGPTGKWDTSQHLDHLLNAAQRLSTAVRLPKMAIRWQFGKPNRTSRNYDEVVARYQEKLKNMPATVNPRGKKHSLKEKAELLKKLKKQGEKLVKGIGKWSEADLDKYLLPHPLLGKLTVREMMLWAIYHHYHHLNNLKSNYK